jgi:hypothetical protein
MISFVALSTITAIAAIPPTAAQTRFEPKPDRCLWQPWLSLSFGIRFNRENKRCNQPTRKPHRRLHANIVSSMTSTNSKSPGRSGHPKPLSLQSQANHARQLAHRIAPIMAFHAHVEIAGRILNSNVHFIRFADALQRDMKKKVSKPLPQAKGSPEPGHHLSALGGLKKNVTRIEVHHEHHSKKVKPDTSARKLTLAIRVPRRHKNYPPPAIYNAS